MTDANGDAPAAAADANGDAPTAAVVEVIGKNGEAAAGLGATVGPVWLPSTVGTAHDDGSAALPFMLAA